MNKKNLNIFVNVALFLLILAGSYSWMFTQRSAAEILDYERRLIISGSDIDVDFYALEGTDYVLQEESPIQLGLLQPGGSQLFRMDITNNDPLDTSVKSVFINILGDVEELGPYIIFGGSTPYSFSNELEEIVDYNENTERHFIDFIDEIRIEASSMLSVYFYVQMSDEAENDVADKGISIENIIFIDA